MKQFFKWMAAIMVAVVAVGFAACSHHDDDEQLVSYDSLPASAKQFIADNFSGMKVLAVVKDKDHKGYGGEYEVRLTNGTEVTFNLAGEWVDVDAAPAMTVPAAVVPQPIADYVAKNYAGAGINEISKSRTGYEVELTTGVDLEFSASGDFIRVDR